MKAVKPDPVRDLDERTARLHAQFAAKSSLFDVLSPPPPPKLDPAATEDRKLQSAIRAIASSNVFLLVLAIVCLVFDFAQGSYAGDHFYFFLTLLFIVGLGQSAVVAFRILHRRITALESDLREARRTSSTPPATTSSDAANIAQPSH